MSYQEIPPMFFHDQFPAHTRAEVVFHKYSSETPAHTACARKKLKFVPQTIRLSYDNKHQHTVKPHENSRKEQSASDSETSQSFLQLTTTLER